MKILTTTLQFLPNADGQYGLSLHPSIPLKPWSTMHVFSEVFERYFIDKHTYFTDAHAINLATEIAAMGHRYYYTQTLQPSFFSRMAEEDLQAYVREMSQLPAYLWQTIEGKDVAYCTRYWSGIAYQATNIMTDDFLTENWRPLRYLIQQHVSKRAAGKKLSISKGGIQRPLRWGYGQACQIVHDNDHNREELNRFYGTFENICKLDLDELACHYAGIEFRIRTGSAIQWDIRFINHGGTMVSHKHLSTQSCNS